MAQSPDRHLEIFPSQEFNIRHNNPSSSSEMAKTGTRLPGFCLNRIRPHVRVRSPPPPPIEDKSKEADHVADYNVGKKQEDEKPKNAVEEKPSETVKIMGRKVMVVVDSSIEAKGAIQWALTHTIQSHDTIVLLHVIRQTQQAACDECTKETAPKAYELVQTLKKTCQLKKPEVKVEISVVQGKDKGPVIVEEARKQGAALLVLGQTRQSMTWRLLMMWARGGRSASTSGGGSVGVGEYCIQNAGCMAVAVRRKSKKLGGYLITTKRQKDFWLLA